MKISVIVGHPYEKSFNSAIAQKVKETLKQNGHIVLYHDLCQENFNPVIPGKELISDSSDDELVLLHQQEIKEADGIIIIHPNWWGQPPAILKGWVDRVLRENVAYTFPAGDSGGGEFLPACLKQEQGWCLIHLIQLRSGRPGFSVILWNVSGKIVFLIFAESRLSTGSCFEL